MDVPGPSGGDGAAHRAGINQCQSVLGQVAAKFQDPLPVPGPAPVRQRFQAAWG